MPRRLASAIIACLVLVGCAGRLPVFSDSPRVEREAARIAVHQATFAFVRGDADKAARVVALCDQIIATGEGEMVTIDTLKALIPWNELNPQQRLDAEGLFDLVAAELSARIPDGEDKLPIESVREVTRWVREAAFTTVPSQP